jgi:hypothetical protein
MRRQHFLRKLDWPSFIVVFSGLPMKTNLFESAMLLLRRAREHRDELNRRCKAFFDENPYTTVIEFHRDTSLYVRKARLPKALPPDLFPVAADAFNNLRHALDQAMCACAVAQDPAVNLDGVNFSFGKDPTDFCRKMRTTRKKIAPEIFTTVAAFEPYKTGNDYPGGNDHFWALNELCRANKHRSLIALRANVKQMNVNLATVFSKHSSGAMRPYWIPSKNELIAGSADRPEKLEYDLGLTFYVAIGDIEAIQGLQALDAIDLLSNKVHAVLMALEAETRRLFPAAFS